MANARLDYGMTRQMTLSGEQLPWFQGSQLQQ